MTLVTATVEDIHGSPDNSVWIFHSLLREASDGSGIVTPRPVRVTPVAGVLSIDLDPGFAAVAYLGKEYVIEVTDTPADLWDLIAASVAFPPGTPPTLVAAAVMGYLATHPGHGVYNVEHYGPVDPTGTTFSDVAVNAAISAMGSNPGVLVFNAGTYKLNTTKTFAHPGQGIRGAGSGITTIDYRGTGDCFRVWDSTANPAAHPSTGFAGPITGLSISGFNTGINTCGLHIGDLSNIYIDDLSIVGFNQAGSKGFWGENVKTFSERAYIHMGVSNCANEYVFETNTSHVGDKSSWDYSSFILSIEAAAGQNGITLKNNVDMQGIKMLAYGNFSGGASSNSGVVLTVGTTSGDTSNITGQINLTCETSDSNVGHKDINVGASASISRAYGSLDFQNFNGGAFVAGTATPLNTELSGVINCPSLGRSAAGQSFRATGAVATTTGRTSYAGSTLTINVASGNEFWHQLPSGASAIAFGGASTGEQAIAFDLIIKQPTSGAAATVTWPGNVIWAEETAPPMSSANSSHDYFHFHTGNGSAWYGARLGTASKLLTARNIDGQPFDGTANITVIAPGTHAATSKTTPVDADELPLVDSAASNVLKKLTLANLKTWVKSWIAKADVGLGNVDNTSDATKNAAVATLPNKTLTAPTINNAAALSVGTTAVVETTTPLQVNLGASYGSNTPGSINNQKLSIWDDGAGTRYGFGVSASRFEYQSPAGVSHSFYVNGTQQFAVTASGLVLSTTATISSGTGTPEATVTATVGSMFTRTDGGAGTTLYIKESGTGNTGWVAK